MGDALIGGTARSWEGVGYVMLRTASKIRFRAALALEQTVTAGICGLRRPEILTKDQWQQEVEIKGLLPYPNGRFRAGPVQKE